MGIGDLFKQLPNVFGSGADAFPDSTQIQKPAHSNADPNLIRWAPDEIKKSSGEPVEFVARGSALVDSRIVDDFDKAQKYLSAVPVEKKLFDSVEHGNHPVMIVKGSGVDDDASIGNLIRWDPHTGTRTPDGNSLSPALLLGHEMDHEALNMKAWDFQGKLIHHPNAAYDNREEQRVIMGSERTAAHALGEGIRHTHHGSIVNDFHVDDPTQRYHE